MNSALHYLAFDQSSVRHNLSSNRAFKKLDRGPDEKGKGALWSIDPQHEHLFEEQDARKQAEGKLFGKKVKDVALLGPPLRRSVKGEPKGTPLPPPLTSAPLVKREFHNTNVSAPLTTTIPIKVEPNAPVPHPPKSYHTSTLPASTSTLSANTPPYGALPGPTQAPTSNLPQAPSSTTPQAPTSIPPIPPSVRLPIIVGPVPSSSPDATSNPADVKPIVLHQNTLILNPAIFSHLTPEQARDLEALGAQKALEILQGYIVRFYKEKLRAEGGRGRGRGRVKKSRGGAPNSSRSGAPPDEQGTDAAARAASNTESQASIAVVPPPTSEPPMASLQPSPSELEEPGSPIIIVDDDDDEGSDAHVSKKPRLGETGTS